MSSEISQPILEIHTEKSDASPVIAASPPGGRGDHPDPPIPVRNPGHRRFDDGADHGVGTSEYYAILSCPNSRSGHVLTVSALPCCSTQPPTCPFTSLMPLLSLPFFSLSLV
eukprot:404322-Hanusia_phi.AAC.3